MSDETSAGETGGRCPTPCDPDCDADCHETHDVQWKREHQPEQCPARAGETCGREAMSDVRLEQLAGLAELPCSCRDADCGNYTSALTAQEARELVAEAKRARALLGPPETVWGHQVHADDGHIGDTVPQGGEFAARKAVEYMNTQILGPDAGAHAELVVHEVWHAETEWRVVEDGQ